MNDKRFMFKVNRKVTNWMSSRCVIEAESYEEAEQKMLKAFNDGSYEEIIDEEEDLEMQTEMSPEENGGYSTLELVNYTGQILANNGI